MMKHKKTVLDEREMLEMYRVEHFGLWIMYGLLCAVILVQMLMGAALQQMAGELAVLIISSVAMVIANMHHGIWDDTSRPSVRGNLGYAFGAGVCVAVMLGVTKGKPGAALAVGGATSLMVFAVLTVLMRYMLKKQAKAEKELDNE